MHRSRILIAAAIALAGTAAVVHSQAQKPLTIYSIDVEGGQATLFVSHSGESMLVDTGWAGFNNRDALRIAGVQTGIYPAETPGGWQLIGKTPVKPFDPQRDEPFLLKAGDDVQFYAISRTEYDAWPSR